MGNSADRIVSEETDFIRNLWAQNDQIRLREYIQKNKLRLTEHLEYGESILEIAVPYWNAFEELVTWYLEVEPNFRFDQGLAVRGSSTFESAFNCGSGTQFLELFLKLYGKDRFYELMVRGRLSIMDYFRKHKHRRGERDSCTYLLLDFILRNIPYNQHYLIEAIGEENMDEELLDYYNFDVWYKQEKTGLLFVNKFHWNKAISKNLMLEIYEILKPKALCYKIRRGSFVMYDDNRRKNSIGYFPNEVSDYQYEIRSYGSGYESGGNIPVSVGRRRGSFVMSRTNSDLSLEL